MHRTRFMFGKCCVSSKRIDSPTDVFKWVADVDGRTPIKVGTSSSCFSAIRVCVCIHCLYMWTWHRWYCDHEGTGETVIMKAYAIALQPGWGLPWPLDRAGLARPTKFLWQRWAAWRPNLRCLELKRPETNTLGVERKKRGRKKGNQRHQSQRILTSAYSGSIQNGTSLHGVAETGTANQKAKNQKQKEEEEKKRTEKKCVSSRSSGLLDTLVHHHFSMCQSLLWSSSQIINNVTFRLTDQRPDFRSFLSHGVRLTFFVS